MRRRWIGPPPAVFRWTCVLVTVRAASVSSAGGGRLPPSPAELRARFQPPPAARHAAPPSSFPDAPSSSAHETVVAKAKAKVSSTPPSAGVAADDASGESIGERLGREQDRAKAAAARLAAGSTGSPMNMARVTAAAAFQGQYRQTITNMYDVETYPAPITTVPILHEFDATDEEGGNGGSDRPAAGAQSSTAPGGADAPPLTGRRKAIGDYERRQADEEALLRDPARRRRAYAGAAFVASFVVLVLALPFILVPLFDRRFAGTPPVAPPQASSLSGRR